MIDIKCIQYFVTDKSFTLFWEQPEGVPKDVCYRVFVDGDLAGETNRTHYTVEMLEPEQLYNVRKILYSGYLPGAEKI